MKTIFKAAKESKRFAADAVYAFILAMRYSGLRISETTILARESVVGNRLKLYTAKTGEHVSIVLPEFVSTALRAVKSTNPKYFFWSGESKLPAAVSVWRKRIAKVFEDAKITDGHSHRFRDTFACSLLQAGVSLQDVSVLLGHRSIEALLPVGKVETGCVRPGAGERRGCGANLTEGLSEQS
jgi:integrase